MGVRSESQGVELRVLPFDSAAVAETYEFYDPEIQDAGNLEPPDQERWSRALAKADDLHRAYAQNIQTLRRRLSVESYRYFSDIRNPLFDSNLLSFTSGDLLSGKRTGRGWRPRPQTVLKFLSFDFKKIHTLSYEKLVSVSLRLPQHRWFDSFYPESPDYSSLLHNELTGAGRRLRHRFLFVSGATIDIVASVIRWKAARA